MELKDVILSTLAEIEDVTSSSVSAVKETPAVLDAASVQEVEHAHAMVTDSLFDTPPSSDTSSTRSDEEIRLLEGIRERLLVLFEGFQSPNNVNIEAKVDLTLNFLEYLLATIENRLDTVR